MLRYVLKKLLLFVPTFVVVYAVVYALQSNATGDPVASYHHQEQIQPSKGTYQDRKAADYQYAATSHLLGLDQPAFYLTITSAAEPDTLYKILRKDQREMLVSLIHKTGNWPVISLYYKKLQTAEQQFYNLPDSTRSSHKSSFWAALQKLLIATDTTSQKSLLNNLVRDHAQNATLNSISLALKQSYSDIFNNPLKAALYRPKLNWFGLDNQFHAGLTRIVQGDFGKSYTDNRPVAAKIATHLKWTLLLNTIAIFFIFALGIPLGVYLAQKNGSTTDRIISAASFGMYALPVFWVATMLIHFFATDTYHLNLFPASGVGDPFTSGWGAFTDCIWHLVLPAICLIYHDLTYVTMQMKEAMLEVFQQDYIKTAIAKGLPQKEVVWRHAYPNAIFPLITHISSIVPAMVSGSIMVENIFGIPGMGDLAVRSILSQDWPVVTAIVMVTAALTMVGILLSDIGYAYLNPRVKLNN